MIWRDRTLRLAVAGWWLLALCQAVTAQPMSQPLTRIAELEMDPRKSTLTRAH